MDQSKKHLSKEELVERLKAIAADETPRVESRGAMCYSPSIPKELHIKCQNCGCDITYDSFNDHRAIMACVNEISRLGYDAKLKTICNSCAETLKKELYLDKKEDIWLDVINHVFCFRTSENEEYHRVIANDFYQYQALLTLLQNKPMYYGDYDESHYIADEIETLEFMTGIQFNV